MSKYIPNENSYIGFATAIVDITAPTALEVSNAEELTQFTISVTATAQGNAVPTPSLDSLYETQVPGTSQGSFTADFYRDDTDDTAWETLTRNTKGYFIIGRHSLSGTSGNDNPLPIANDNVEVWPVHITARSAGPITSSTAQMFTCTAAVLEEPAEDATVAA